ncbi:hypothetical protein BCA37_10605 [Mycobacterium sp. djl-10]|nr:hypothetical protein BCA37_10605 [Mycobacterium sp. djl-10]
MREPNRGGPGARFLAVLFLIFLVLKLGVGDTEVQSWSWWWVFGPIWIPVAVLLVLALLVAIVKAASR